MTCAVRSCRIEAYRRPDLSFFSLPRQHHLQDEWLEVLGIEKGNFTGTIKVCELHFKPKDFCSSIKKQLKSHAVPVLRLGGNKTEPIDSDDEFMDYNSEGDDDIIELKPNKSVSDVKVKREPAEKESMRQATNEDATEGRRPSRRAAREAAKKIHNTVRNFMSSAPVNIPVSPIPVIKQRRRSTSKGNPIDIDLVMECYEEVLSPVQAEALLKAQLEYNMVMKTLRSLKANNVKIICSKEPYPFATVASTANGSTVSTTVGSNPVNPSNAGANTIPVKSPVVPLMLSTSS